MFTGIVERTGTVKQKRAKKEIVEMVLEGGSVVRSLRLGDSLAVNGVCLTVAGRTKQTALFQMVPETLKATNLGELKEGDRVNLERSCRASDRLGGHFVLGHVDATGKISHIEKRDDSWSITVKAPNHLTKYFVDKASVALDGISLTIQKAHKDSFEVAIIPHTLEITSLGDKRVGSRVNLEVDMLAKYVEKLLVPGGAEVARTPLTESFLVKQGF